MEPERSAAAIVVLGCRIEASGALSSTLERRVASAARAFFANVSDTIVASGGRRWGEFIEAEQVRARLVALGVPREAVLVELLSLTTAENAVYSVDIVRRFSREPAPSVAIATSSWHMRRAAWCFARVGATAILVPAIDPPAGPSVRLKRAAHESASLLYDAATLELAGDRGTAFLGRRTLCEATR